MLSSMLVFQVLLSNAPFGKVRGESFDVVARRSRKQPLRLLVLVRIVGQRPARDCVDFGIVDLLAPTPAVMISVACVLRKWGLETAGNAWDDGCPRSLNDQVKKGGVMACNQVGGLSGCLWSVSGRWGDDCVVQERLSELRNLEAIRPSVLLGWIWLPFLKIRLLKPLQLWGWGGNWCH